MKVVVIGGGILGVASAWWLRQAGHDVEVIDRRPAVAQGASFANGGQISVSYAEPWAKPGAPWKLARWALRDDAPLLFRPRADWRQWRWGLSFLRECLPSRQRANLAAMVAMADYSRRTLQGMRASLGIPYDHLERGILTFYRTQSDFEDAQHAASLMRDAGVDRRIVSVDEAIAIEPALAHARGLIAGGDYTQDDESGDARAFTLALAERAVAAGVQFRHDAQVTRLLADGGRVYALELLGDDGRHSRVQADAYVVAAGVGSERLVAPLGVSCPVYPAKGYSATFPVLNPEQVPEVSLIDSSRKVVISRLGNRLRVAGTAEFSGYSLALNTVRCEALARIVNDLLPAGAVDITQPGYWTGLRPAMPSSVPLIGRTRVSNLYLNTGHGTLGWTMGMGSGRALADIVSGQRPEPVFPFLGAPA